MCNVCQTYLSKTLFHRNAEFRTYLENARGGKLKKLEITHKGLQQICPDVIRSEDI